MDVRSQFLVARKKIAKSVFYGREGRKGRKESYCERKRVLRVFSEGKKRVFVKRRGLLLGFW